MTGLSIVQLRIKLGNQSKQGIYERMKKDPRFPRPLKIGRRSIWIAEEVDEYLDSLADDRDAIRANS